MPGTVIGTAIALVAAIMALVGFGLYSAATSTGAGRGYGLVAVAAGVGLVAVLVGVWRGWEVGRGGAIMAATLGVLAGLVLVGAGNPRGGLVAAGVGVAIIVCLTRRDAKAWFGRA